MLLSLVLVSLTVKQDDNGQLCLTRCLAWATFIRDTLSLKSLDECAANISVSHPTSFYMRHKLLSFLEEALKEGELLEGIVEVDETYALESPKGVPVTARKPSKSKTKRNFSDEQMCICVAADGRAALLHATSIGPSPPLITSRKHLGSGLEKTACFCATEPLPITS